MKLFNQQYVLDNRLSLESVIGHNPLFPNKIETITSWEIDLWLCRRVCWRRLWTFKYPSIFPILLRHVAIKVAGDGYVALCMATNDLPDIIFLNSRLGQSPLTVGWVPGEQVLLWLPENYKK